jgi:aryl-alcohol dehydrogenase-like predicted oxidoreductase
MDTKEAVMKRQWGKTGIETSALGMGCWPAGGVWNDPGRTVGWNGVTDDESVAAIRVALDEGVTLFDTADVYSSGHSELLLGRALEGRRNDVVLATKFGCHFEEGVMNRHDQNGVIDAAFVRRALEGSLRRLNTDFIDFYQLHLWEYEPGKVAPLLEVLESQVAAGKIGGYGWSTDQYAGIEAFQQGPHAVATQILFNVFEGAQKALDFAEKAGIAALARSPLAMGLLSGRYDGTTALPGDDVRSTNDEWIVWFKDGRPTPEYLKRLAAVREILTSGGRSMVQGALAWLWARSPALIPIPGAKNRVQARENAAAMRFGPLTRDQMLEVARLTSFRDITA